MRNAWRGIVRSAIALTDGVLQLSVRTIEIEVAEALDVTASGRMHLRVPEVAGKHLVGTLPALHHLDMLRNTLSEQIESHRVLPNHRFGHMINGFRQPVQHFVVWHMDFVVPGGVTLDDLVGKLELAALFFRLVFETDRKGMKTLDANLGQQGDQQAGIQAAGKKKSGRARFWQTISHSLLMQRIKFFDPFLFIFVFSGGLTGGNGGQDEATVTISMPGVNDPPVAEDNDVGVVLGTGPIGGNNMLSNDSDAEDDNLTVTKIGGQDIASGPDTTVSLPSGAILTIDTNTGDFTVDPSGHFDFLDSNETALVTFEYVISDGNGGTDAATVTLTLQGDNGAPYAEDDSKTVLPTGSVSSSMMANDSDPENDELTVISVEGTADPSTSSGGVAVVRLPSGAMVTVSKSGEYTYDPSGHFDSLDDAEEGVDTFTYTISDGKGGTDEATVTILMPGVNDPPVAENDVHSLKVADGEELAFSDNALANDSDPEDDDLTVTAVNRDGDKVGTEITLPSGANVTLETDGTYTYEPAGEFESLSHGESASDTFEYTVSDGKGGTEVATVTIIIHGDNSEPVAADDSESTTEDATVSYDSILENDSDPEKDALTVKKVEGDEGAARARSRPSLGSPRASASTTSELRLHNGRTRGE